MRVLRYDISNFYWDAESNSFYVDLLNLFPIDVYLIDMVNADEDTTEYIFNGKDDFIIYNPKTEGSRTFRYIKHVYIDYETGDIIEKISNDSPAFLTLLFQSEDGINCYIHTPE